MRSGKKPKRWIDPGNVLWPSPERGFTLLEVVVAIAILALFLTPVLGSVSNGLRSVDRVRSRSLALRLAQDKMSEVEMVKVPDAEETSDGDFGDDYPGYRWEMETVKTPELELLEMAITTTPIVAWEVHLRVFWTEDGGERSVELSTILVGRKS